MKLLTVTNFFDTHSGGLEIVAGRLARTLSARGCETTWLATEETPAPGDLACIPVPAWNLAERRLGVPFPILGPRGLGAIVRAVRKADAVLLHDSLYMSSIAAFLAAKALGRPVLVVQHIGEVPYRNPVLRGAMRLGNLLAAKPLLALADQVVFISETTRRYFHGVRFRRPPRLVFNGVDGSVFHPGARQEARAAVGIEGGARFVLFVGRFVEKKGLHMLRAAAEARPDVVWGFAGWGPIEPGAWGLANVRVFSGLTGDGLANLYRAADALVLPSQGEGFPLVIQEALACGLPVVCSAEMLAADPAAAPHLNGVPIPTDAGGSEVGAVCRALDAALAGRTEAGDRDRAAFAAQRYSWDQAADRYSGLLHAMMRGADAVPVQELAT